MKLTRLSLLLLVLMVSFLVSPEAFGAKGNTLHGKRGHHARIPNAKVCEWFDISCNDGSSDVCCGNVDSCLGYCSDVCGGPCIYQQ